MKELNNTNISTHLYYITMKESLIQQCLDILKRENVKNELHLLLNPFVNVILSELKPYIYMILIYAFCIFFMLLAILILFLILLYNKHSIPKIL